MIWITDCISFAFWTGHRIRFQDVLWTLSKFESKNTDEKRVHDENSCLYKWIKQLHDVFENISESDDLKPAFEHYAKPVIWKLASVLETEDQ